MIVPIAVALLALSVTCLIFCRRAGATGTGPDTVDITPQWRVLVLALPLLRSACAMLNEMATFESAQVSGKNSVSGRDD